MKKSAQGVNGGVYFIDTAIGLLAAKSGKTIFGEVLATLLAQAVGLNAPDILHVAPKPSSDLRERCGNAQDRPIFVMSTVVGRSFNELQDNELTLIRACRGNGKKIIEAIGTVCAYDYLIGDHDRFPVRGLTARNPGNLMLTAEGTVVCIDNTPLPAYSLVNPKALKLHDEFLGRALDAARPGSTSAEAMFGSIVDFFPSTPPVKWQTIQQTFLEGFRTGAQRIAALSTEDLEARIAQSGAVEHDGSDLANFLRKNLAVFKDKAPGLATTDSDADS